MRSLILLSLVLVLPGCLRSRKFLGAENYVMAERPRGEVAEVVIHSGWKDEPAQVWAPTEEPDDAMTGPMTITEDGSVSITPQQEDVRLSLWLRHTGWNHGGFTQIKTVTGAIPGSISNEIRFLPERLDERLELPMHQLQNVYNDYDVRDGDLLVIEVEAPDGAVERYSLVTTEFGVIPKFGVGVLVRTPLPFFGNAQGEVAPAFAATAAFRYRFRTQNPFVTWLGRRVAVVTSMGVGSTALQTTDQSLQEELRAVFNAVVAGGGLEYYDFLSLQLLVNLSSLGRERPESTTTFAVGFDAVQFGRFTADAFTRLFWNNHLDKDRSGR